MDIGLSSPVTAFPGVGEVRAGKLEKLGRLDVMKCAVQLRNYATDEAVSK